MNQLLVNNSIEYREQNHDEEFIRKLPFWLSVFLIFTLPWENILVFKELGTIGRVAGLVTAASWVFMVIVTGKIRIPRPIHFLIFLFLSMHVVSVYWTIDLGMTRKRLFTYIQLIGLIYVLWDIYVTPAKLKIGLQAYVLGASVSIYSLLSNYFAGISAYTGRYVATGFDPNNIGIILALGIPIAWYLATFKSYNRLTSTLKMINYIYVPAAVLAVLLTASRGALLTMAPALLYVIGSMTRLRLVERVLIFLILLGSLYALKPLVPQASLDRLATTDDSISERDLNGRVSIWLEGFDILSSSPILGVGSNAFRAGAVQTGQLAHNSYLSILVELGVVGFSLFGIVIVIVLYQSIRLIRWDSAFWLTVLVVLMIGIFSTNWAHRKQTWMFLSLVVVGSSLSIPERDPQKRRSSPENAQMSGIPTLSIPQSNQGTMNLYRQRGNQVEKGGAESSSYVSLQRPLSTKKDLRPGDRTHGKYNKRSPGSNNIRPDI